MRVKKKTHKRPRGRPDAKTLKDRIYQYQAGVIVGQGYSTVAWIPEAHRVGSPETKGSWALPLLHERISSAEAPIPKAAAQLKQVCEQTKRPVLAVLDREYGNATWVLASSDIRADCLMRVRRNACCWSAPPAYSGRGRPRKHGEKMKLNDPNTWTEADETLEIEEHPRLGQVRVSQWKDLHFYRAAGHLVNLILVERMKPITLNLTPGRVAQSMLPVLVEIGTPAQLPKPRGKSPGWTEGNTRTKPPRYPTVKKRASRPPKSPKIAA